MSKCAIALSSRENSTIAFKYDYNYCPSCGSALSSSVHVSIEFYEPELGFAGDLSRCYDYSGDVMISWKGLCVVRWLCPGWSLRQRIRSSDKFGHERA